MYVVNTRRKTVQL